MTVFAGWAASQLASGWPATTGLPGHDAFLEFGTLPTYSAWLTSGSVVGVLSALLVWFTDDTVSPRVPVLIVVTLTAAPVVGWMG